MVKFRVYFMTNPDFFFQVFAKNRREAIRKARQMAHDYGMENPLRVLRTEQYCQEKL